MSAHSPPRAREILEQERPQVEAALKRVLARELPRIDETLAAPIRYALLGGGKRLRPVLCVTACRAVGGRADPAVYEAACALEIVHTYSLVHDDLPCMDDDDRRRGRATTHKVFGTTRAAIAAAAMIPLACAVLDKAAAALGQTRAQRAATTRELLRAAGADRLIGGQMLDLEAEHRPLDAADLEAIQLRKTGALFAAAFRMGGRLANAPHATVDTLGRAGLSLGLAFQITDDLLDVTGTAGTLGKTAGRDRQRGKATWPVLLGVEAAREHAARASERALAELRDANIRTESLEALIEFAVQRDR